MPGYQTLTYNLYLYTYKRKGQAWSTTHDWPTPPFISSTSGVPAGHSLSPFLCGRWYINDVRSTQDGNENDDVALQSPRALNFRLDSSLILYGITLSCNDNFVSAPNPIPLELDGFLNFPRFRTLCITRPVANTNYYISCQR